ncbi:hypothetical protein Rhe02_47300 [Rhizocola hellebori]|uniref:Uncharacterized protein n=1 Tax=Rhizocola hellebori TaxID=1392758 RepID=A0A8J3Q9J8_9ACTN|nr:hypothetical protein Rhe02_47300 [Rhizocola hellebori]
MGGHLDDPNAEMAVVVCGQAAAAKEIHKRSFNVLTERWPRGTLLHLATIGAAQRRSIPVASQRPTLQPSLNLISAHIPAAQPLPDQRMRPLCSVNALFGADPFHESWS